MDLQKCYPQRYALKEKKPILGEELFGILNGRLTTINARNIREADKNKEKKREAEFTASIITILSVNSLFRGLQRQHKFLSFLL